MAEEFRMSKLALALERRRCRRNGQCTRPTTLPGARGVGILIRQKLESVYSNHFGRTPVSTPFASQELDESCEVDYEVDNDDIDTTGGILEGRVRDYILQQEIVDEDTDSDGNGEAELDESDIEVAEYCALTDIKKVCKYGYDRATATTKKGKKRQRMRYTFKFNGSIVCRITFHLCYDIGRSALQGLMAHMATNGIVPRTHGNTGRRPKHALTFDDVQRVVKFFLNYAEREGLPMPAAPRGRDNIPPTYLPASETKLKTFKEYEKQAVEAPIRCVKLTAFKTIWSTCVPHIKIASPRDDVCATCEKIRKRVMDAVEEDDKNEAADAYSAHITKAQQERELYNDCIRRSTETRHTAECERYHHFTFDFAESVSLPHYYRQMGPLFFLSLRKISIFGFRIDGDPHQLNFLIDENEAKGKDGSKSHGPDAVISMIDWALQNYGGQSTSCSIHADNCTGLNKNKYLVGYFMWRVMTGQHSTIEYLMQIIGHAKCLVDSGFGNAKRLYRRTDCESLDQLEDVVNKFSYSNTAVRYPAWSWRNLKGFLGDHFKALNGIRKYQYFRFSSTEPVRTSRDAEEDTQNVLKDPAFRFETQARPDVVQAAGFSHPRQESLYKCVRQYVRPPYQDILCPVPNTL
ncbi:uncharacterized protein LOC128246360 [Mya arenaria]|uniref:uncharacterized protein LOC128246360 n=1 Tax=Mya arenaria TaxID=6604 RepID=UPI0022E56BE8|nr:uncharacterized protein LOC128246360 [Mya arenaria]